MRHDLIVSQTGLIDASLEKVWRGLTDPEIIKLYLHGTQTITDWKVGSEIVFQGEYEGHVYRDHGQILEFTPHKKISYTYFSGFLGLPDVPENYMEVSYLLEDRGQGQTALTWMQSGYADEAAQQKAQAGMEAYLVTIKAAIEENA